MSRQRLPAERRSEKPPPGEPDDHGLRLLRLNPKSLSIAFALTVLAGIGAYRVNLTLEVPELLFVLVVCYALVHAGRWVLARRKPHGEDGRTGRHAGADESGPEESSPEGSSHHGMGLLDAKSLAIAFVAAVLVGVYAYWVNLPLQTPELLFVLVACYGLVHAGRWVWARIKAGRK